ncbi:MAG: hypothetical protein IJ519_05390 [Clostridia bacterium]|nr:hypothetical protein [Clostridia bacterium]
MSFTKSMVNLFVRNKRALIFFLVCALVNLVLSFADFFLATVAVSVVSITAIVLFFRIVITELKAYYRALKNGALADTVKLYINTLLSISLTLILVLALTLTAFAATFILPPAGTVDGVMISEEEMTEEQKQLVADTADALDMMIESIVERNYGSAALYVTCAVVFILSTFMTVIELLTAASFAVKFGRSPILTIIIALIVISIAKEFLSSLTLSLITLVAPGINSAINEIAAFFAVSGTEENSAKFIYDMAKTLPYAATVIKMMITTAMCSLVPAITNVIVTLSVIKKK